MQRQRKQEIEQLIRDYQNRGEMTRQQFCESRSMTLLHKKLNPYGTDLELCPDPLVMMPLEVAASQLEHYPGHFDFAESFEVEVSPDALHKAETSGSPS